MKQKIQQQAHYTKVGRFNATIAKQIHRKAADIYIDENHIKHIFNKHIKELSKFGLTPKLLLETITVKFNRIYKGHRNALVLVLWNGKANVAVIEMNESLKKEFYEVKTTTIMRKDFFKDTDLLWQKK